MRSEWEPRVRVVKRSNRPTWVFRWKDSHGRFVEESSDIPISQRRSQAERAAVAKEDQLKSAGAGGPVTWQSACDMYVSQKLAGLSKGTRENWQTTRNWIKELLDPAVPADLTTNAIDTFAEKLRKAGKAPDTIAGHLRYIRAFLRWCKRKSYLRALPDVEMPADSGNTKRSRDITLEEFDRLLLVVEKVRPNDAARWKRFLEGLWHSGLRISELVALRWAEPGDVFIDFAQQFPGFHFTEQKNRKEQWVPMTPEFFRRFIEPIPHNRRRGYVFSIPTARREQVSTKWATQVVLDIGEKAGIKTAADKFASSHDIGRRAFTTRHTHLSQWQLAALMRHESPATTAKFYVGDQAMGAAATLWSGTVFSGNGDISVTSPQKSEAEG